MHLALVGLFVSNREEKLVLDDGPADVEAVVLLVEGIGDDRVAFQRVARQAVVVEQVERRTGELVRSRLGDDVDRAARELAVLNVERCEFDCGRGDRVVGDRKSEPRRRAGAFVQAEAVARDCAVDRNRVGARVSSQAVDTVAGAVVGAAEAHARVDTNDVADLALDARHRLDLLDGKRRSRSNGEFHSLDHFRGDDDLLDICLFLQLDREVGRLGQRRVYVRDQRVLILRGLDPDRVGAADGQAAKRKCAGVRSRCNALRASAGVGYRDAGAWSRAAVRCRNNATDAGGRFLCESCNRDGYQE